MAQVPPSNHVWIITEENHSYENVIGNPAMPYYNSLVQQYALATQYYSDQHGSLPALMWLVAGQPVTTNEDNTACFDVNNVVRQLLLRARTWRAYEEDLPYAGFTGLYSLEYVRRHNPLIDFTDACASSQMYHSVPFSQLNTDLQNNTTPNYAYITPNLLHDAHDGTLGAADTWLSLVVPRILARPEFKPGNDGLLFIVWDEGNLSTDNRCSATVLSGCGGRVATLVIGPQVNRGFRSTTLYHHENLLRTVCDAMRFSSCPGAAATARPMADMFARVLISAPANNSTVSSPVTVQATTQGTNAVYAVQVYVDNSLKYQVSGNSVNTQLALPTGTHNLVVQSWDVAGGIHKSAVTITVLPPITILSPAPNATVSSPVPIQATTADSNGVYAMQIYVDYQLKYQVSGASVNTWLSMSSGTHNIIVQSWDKAGGINKAGLSVTVK